MELVQVSKISNLRGYRFKPISLKLDFIDSFQNRIPDAYEQLIIGKKKSPWTYMNQAVGGAGDEPLEGTTK